MSVIRIKKAHKPPYVIIDTTALNDVRLSFRAKGLHTYLMSKTDDWQVYIEQLEKESPTEGRDAIRTGLSELEASGYIKRERARGARGRMQGWDTTVYETPALAAEDGQNTDGAAEQIGLSESVQPKSVQPKSVQPKSVQPKSANPQLLRIDLNLGLNPERIDESNPPLSPQGESGDVQSTTFATKLLKKTRFPRDPQQQAQLKTSIIDAPFHIWFAKKGLTLDLEEQWEKFTGKAVANGYRYVDWRQAFMNWLLSPYQQLVRISPTAQRDRLHGQALLDAMEEVQRSGHASDRTTE